MVDLMLILTRFIRSQHRHNPVAATSQAHQMQTWLVVAVVAAATQECTASKSDSRKIDFQRKSFPESRVECLLFGHGAAGFSSKRLQEALAYLLTLYF